MSDARAVAEIPAEATTDDTARRFVCDRPAGHAAEGVAKHRQVTDPAEGVTIEWPDDITRGLAAALASVMAETAAAAETEDPAR